MPTTLAEAMGRRMGMPPLFSWKGSSSLPDKEEEYLPITRTSSDADEDGGDSFVEKPETTMHTSTRRRHWAHLGVVRLVQAFLLTFAIYGMYSGLMALLPPKDDGGHHHDQPELARGICNCGRTVREAESLGCIFDQIQMAWLPPICRDDELLDEYMTHADGPHHTWLYFDNEDHSIVLTPKQVAHLAETGGYVAASIHWHITHCSFMWLKMMRAEEKGIRVGHRLNTEGHARHCFRDVFMKGEPHNHTVGGIGITLAADWLPGDAV